VRVGGQREGCVIVALEGLGAPLAHSAFKSPYRVGKYGVDVANLERVGVVALRQALREWELVVVDEIGKMELFSPAFRRAVAEALDGANPLLGTIMLAPQPEADRIKAHPQVELTLLTRANRAQVAQEVLRWIQAWLKALKSL